MALALDGHANGIISGAAANTVAATLTTTSTNDVVVAVINNNHNTTRFTVSSISGGGLTWAKRTGTGQTTSTGAEDNLEIWYAIAASPLTAQTITATLSGSALSAAMVVFGVSGANTGTPFDVNGAVPATTNDTSNTVGAVPSTTFSTTNANTFVFAGVGGTAALPAANNVSGFTAVDRVDGFSGASNFFPAYIDVNYQVYSAAQTGTTAGFTSNNTAWMLLVDAIQQAGAGAVASVKPTRRAPILPFLTL